MVEQSQPAYDSQDDSGDELFANDVHNTVPTQLIERAQHVTQPTQRADTPYDRRSNTPQAQRSSPSVQVAASSPVQTPRTPSVAPMNRGSLNGGLMAPPGTQFKPPGWSQQRQASQRPSEARSQTLNFTQEDIIDSDSDDDALGQTASLQPTKFNRGVPSPRVEESPQKSQQDFSRFAYNPTLASKRPIDDMASAYGGSRRPVKVQRQTGPSRPTQPKMTIDDVTDYDVKANVEWMRMIWPQASVRQCYSALLKKKGNRDDAGELLAKELDEEEQRQQNPQHSIDLTKSDNDERQFSYQFKKPIRREAQNRKTLTEKWSSTQRSLPPKPPQPPQSSVLDTPDPLHGSPPKKERRRLVQGRKQRSPSPVPKPSSSQTTGTRKPTEITISDDEDEAVESGANSEEDDLEVVGPEDEMNIKVLSFINACSLEDLIAQSNHSAENAKLVLSRRPFSSMSEIIDVTAESTSTTKTGKTKIIKRKVGEMIADALQESIKAYEAIDRLVEKCEGIGRPVAERMKQWGINVYGSSENDGLSMTDLDASHDSGIGTPSSSASGEDEVVSTKLNKRKVLGQPSNMNNEFKMKDYQVAGLNWLSLLYSEGLSCILADDMGLGKTYQVIAFLAHLLETGETGPHLIIVPASTIENWLMEFRRFCPQLIVEPYHENQKERGARQEEILELLETKSINVIVTTYDMAWKPHDNKFLRHCKPVSCVFDEGHMLKNCQSRRYTQLAKINAKFRLLLTGTPLQNNLRELVSLLAFIMPEVFESEQDNFNVIFTKHKAKTYDTDHTSFLAADRIDRARAMMKPFILRRKKQQVLKHLPAKTSRVEYCTMPPSQQTIYNEQSAKLRHTLLTADGNEDESAKSKPKPKKNKAKDAGVIDLSQTRANVLMDLRKAAIHPLLFRHRFDTATLDRIATQFVRYHSESTHALVVEDLSVMTDFEINRFCLSEDHRSYMSQFALREADIESWLLGSASGKVAALTRVLDAFGPDDRVLIFSQFTMVLDVLEAVLDTRGTVFARLDGATRIADRQELINAFGTDKDIRVFLLSTKAGGQGINLAAANKVVLFDAGFNPQEEVQAENRAHRVGQEREVEVIRLVTKGSVEEMILKLGESKLLLDERVAGDGDGGDEGTSREDTPAASAADGDSKADRPSNSNESKGMLMVEEMLKNTLAHEDRDAADGRGSHVQLANANADPTAVDDDTISDLPSTPSNRPRRAAASASKDAPAEGDGLPVRGRRQKQSSRTSSQAEKQKDDEKKLVRSGLEKFGFRIGS